MLDERDSRSNRLIQHRRWDEDRYEVETDEARLLPPWRGSGREDPACVSTAADVEDSARFRVKLRDRVADAIVPFSSDQSVPASQRQRQ